MGKFFDAKFTQPHSHRKGHDSERNGKLVDDGCGDFIVDNMRVRLGAAISTALIQNVSSGPSSTFLSRFQKILELLLLSLTQIDSVIVTIRTRFGVTIAAATAATTTTTTRGGA